MSRETMDWFWDEIAPKPMDPTCKLLLCFIADGASHAGGSFFKAPITIAKRLGVTERTVRRWLATLVSNGVLEIEAAPFGRRPTTYRIAALATESDGRDELISGDTHDTRDALDGRSTDARVSPGALDTTLRSKGARSTSSSGLRPADAVDDLCRQLAEAIEGFSGKRPRITTRWKADMDLLLRRGPAEWATPEPISSERISRCITFVFTKLNVRNGDLFCWADQVRSPSALRKHFERFRRLQSVPCSQRSYGPGPNHENHRNAIAYLLDQEESE